MQTTSNHISAPPLEQWYEAVTCACRPANTSTIHQLDSSYFATYHSLVSALSCYTNTDTDHATQSLVKRPKSALCLTTLNTALSNSSQTIVAF